MSNCPNCDYLLVLLEHRRKYKCAKCGKLFSQKEIESAEFRTWNKKEREKEKKEAKRESKKEYAKKKRKEINAWMRDYYARNREKLNAYQKAWQKENEEKVKQQRKERYWKNKEKISQQKAGYYEVNRDLLVEKSRQWRKRLSGQEKKEQNEKRKSRRYRNIDDTRLQGRINYWKQQQKTLALRMYENELNTAYSQQLQQILPTFQLSYLLLKQQNLYTLSSRFK